MRTPADDGLDNADRKLLSDVERHGWHVAMIPDEDGTPGWSFSIGLFHTFGHPEIVVFGLPLDLACNVINGIGTDIKRGSTFEAGWEYPDILEGVECAFRPVHSAWYRPFLGYARWYYRGDTFPVLQCIWPDKRQKYPWEPAFKKEWLWAQPLLFESDAESARAVRLLASIKNG